jgi:hypothetical protein
VILTDIAPPRGCPEPHAFLIEQGDALTAMHRGVAVPLGATGQAHDTYLSTIADLDRAAGCVMAPAAPAVPANNAEAPKGAGPAASPSGSGR